MHEDVTDHMYIQLHAHTFSHANLRPYVRYAPLYPSYSPSSRLILSLTSLKPYTRLTRPGLAGPPNSSPICLTGVLNRPSVTPPLTTLAPLDGEAGGPNVKPAESFLDPGVGDPGSSSIGGFNGLPLVTPPLIFRGGVIVPVIRGLPSTADIRRDEADVVPGDGGNEATAEGISSHSFRATVL